MRFIEPRRNPWRSLSGEDGPVVGIQPVAQPAARLRANGTRSGPSGPKACRSASRSATTSTSKSSHADLPRLALVALNFPKWVDGRAYSQAHLLRARYRFEGEIRATGEVLVDMLPLLQRTGFDAVVLRGDQSQDAARRALGFFPGHYQGDVRDAQPLFAKPDGTADALVRKAAPEFVSAGEGI